MEQLSKNTTMSSYSYFEISISDSGEDVLVFSVFEVMHLDLHSDLLILETAGHSGFFSLEDR